MSWETLLAPNSKIDGYLRLFAAICLFMWNVSVSTHMHTPFPSALVDAYAVPATRIFLLVLVLFASAWCPTVGILAALAYVSLGADVLLFSKTAQNQAV